MSEPTMALNIGPPKTRADRRTVGLPQVVVDAPAERLAGLRIHDLRHTAAALWIAAGPNPKEVAARAGHTSVSFTLDRYGHLYPDADQALRDRLDALRARSQARESAALDGPETDQPAGSRLGDPPR
jgi:integrase